MRRLLVVEDDQGIREALADLLEELGYQPLVANDGGRGLELARQQSEPCPVLLDWRVPVLDCGAFRGGGCSGCSFPRRIARCCPRSMWAWWEASPSPSTWMHWWVCSTRPTAGWRGLRASARAREPERSARGR